MRSFTAAELTIILGDCLSAPILSDVIVCKLSTDTRTLTAGDTFVALSGERFDGHYYLSTAIEKGATTLMVERQHNVSDIVAQIVVTDTRLALGIIARTIRDDFVACGGRVVGLTGSVGKTTNKQMLASILSQAGKAHATKGNLNNDLGVPFTWFDLPDNSASIKDYHKEDQFAIIEMGANHLGEIDYLSKITKPHVAMITNAGEAHLEGFGGLDGVAKGKGELFQNLSADDIAVINLDNNYVEYWRGLLANGVAHNTFSLSNTNADVYASDIAKNGSEFTLNTPKGACKVKIPTIGRHNVMNALGSATCALALDVSLECIVKGLTKFNNAKGRLQIIEIEALTIIDDTYNANPMSMRASSDILSDSDGYRIMVLGDMGELGDTAYELHAKLGKDLRGKAEIFLCLGDNMRAFAKANDSAKHFDNIGVLNRALLMLIEKNPSVTVLVKGSRSMQMERTIFFLQNEQKCPLTKEQKQTPKIKKHPK